MKAKVVTSEVYLDRTQCQVFFLKPFFCLISNNLPGPNILGHLMVYGGLPTPLARPRAEGRPLAGPAIATLACPAAEGLTHTDNV